MGISWRQSRTGRASGGNRDSGIPRGIGDHDLGTVPGALYVRVAHLSGFSTPDASVCLPAMGRHGHGARAYRAQMVEAARVDGTGDAASRSAARRHAARSTLAALLRDTNGATSIEYALIASLVSIL